MSNRVVFCARLGVVAALLSVAEVSFALVSVVNYDNHPDLEKAKRYDLTVDNKEFMRVDGTFDQERYRSYLAGADREQAERHYLTYLENVTDSFQRAAVYARLGEMFGGIADPRVATTIDRGKAHAYFQKALEAEPERIGWPTLQARGFLATDTENNEQRFASYTDYYQWLLSIDEKKLRENWLPTQPPRARPVSQEDETRRRLRAQFEAKRPPRPHATRSGGMLETIQAQADVTASNLVFEAAGRMGFDPQTHEWSQARAIQHLVTLRERFPGTSAAEKARAELEKLRAGVADGPLSNAEGNLATTTPPTTSHADANAVEAEMHAAASQPHDPNGPSDAGSDPNGPSQSMLPPQKGSDARQAAVLAACLGLVALTATALCIANRRANAHSGEIAAATDSPRQ